MSEWEPAGQRCPVSGVSPHLVQPCISFGSPRACCAFDSAGYRKAGDRREWYPGERTPGVGTRTRSAQWLSCRSIPRLDACLANGEEVGERHLVGEIDTVDSASDLERDRTENARGTTSSPRTSSPSVADALSGAVAMPCAIRLAWAAAPDIHCRNLQTLAGSTPNEERLLHSNRNGGPGGWRHRLRRSRRRNGRLRAAAAGPSFSDALASTARSACHGCRAGGCGGRALTTVSARLRS